MNSPATSIEQRITAAVTRKLGVPVTFGHWIKKPTGDVPVLCIPKAQQPTARALGLTFELAA